MSTASAAGERGERNLYFAKLFPIIVLLLTPGLPTAAQNSPAPRLNPTAPTTLPARLDGPLPLVNMASLRRPALLPQRPALVPALTLTVPLEAPLRLPAPVYAERTLELAPRVIQTHNHSASLESSVGYVETPFGEEARLPLASLAGGRLQFGPFYNFSQTENVLMGLPGAGSLPAWSGMQNHAGVTVPLADESYGLNLSIRLKRDPEPGPRIHLLRCVGWVLGARGCVSN